MRFPRLLIASIILVVCGQAYASCDGKAALDPGASAPDFCVRTFQGSYCHKPGNIVILHAFNRDDAFSQQMWTQGSLKVRLRVFNALNLLL